MKVNNINYMMGLNNLLTDDLAEIVGVDRSTVNSWRRGDTEPNDENKRKLAGAFGCNISEIFTKNAGSSKNNLIGKNIRRFRKLNNLDQTELGKILNVKQTTISSYETGGRQVPDFIQESLIRIFGISKEELLGNSSENYSKLTSDEQMVKRMCELERRQEMLVSKIELLKDEVRVLKIKVDDQKTKKKGWFF